jgi:hypothetical protein
MEERGGDKNVLIQFPDHFIVSKIDLIFLRNNFFEKILD